MRQTQLHKLTARAAQHAKPGKHSDGGGLWLVVSDSGNRKWVLRHTVDSKRRERGLGGFPAVSLADARAKAAALREGRPEAAPALPAVAPTFRTAMDRYLALRGGEWSNSKHAAQWPYTLNRYAAGLMDRAVDTITTRDVAACLVPIWQGKQETASRVRQRIERILSAAIALGDRDGPNPAAWRDNLELVLGKQVRQVAHHAAVPVADAPDAFARLWRKRDDGQGARGLLVVCLTALRSGEVRNLTWADYDAGGAILTLPAERMKARRAHRVPVVPVLADLLDAWPHYAGCGLVLPSSRNTPISDATMGAAMKRAGLGQYTPHGWRSVFSDWAHGEGYNHRWVEDQLAHTVGSDVERAYRRGDYMEQRRPMMAAWCDYLTSGI